MTKKKLTAKQFGLMRHLELAGGWLTAKDLTAPERANGTILHSRGLCEWKLPHSATDNDHRQLHITDAGRKALEEAVKC